MIIRLLAHILAMLIFGMLVAIADTNTASMCTNTVTDRPDELLEDLEYISAMGSMYVYEDIIYIPALSLHIPIDAMDVVILTNTVLSNNGVPAYRQSYRHGGWTLGCLVYKCTEDHDLVQAVPATEKYEDEIVTQIKTYTYSWDNATYITSHRRIMSIKRRTLYLKWHQADEVEHLPVPEGILE